MRRGRTAKVAVLAGTLLVLAVVLAGIGMPEVALWIDLPTVYATPTPSPQPLVLVRPAAADQVAGLPPTLVAPERLRVAAVPNPLRTPVPLVSEATPEPAEALQVLATGPAAPVAVPV